MLIIFFEDLKALSPYQDENIKIELLRIKRFAWKKMKTKAELKQKVKFLESEISNTLSYTYHPKCDDLLKSVYYERIAYLESQLKEVKKELEK